jgi:hypothetical protein
MNNKYKLEGHDTVLVHDLLEWAAWFETAERRVARSTVVTGIEVSTVFLGLDYSFGMGEPLLFETMVFGGPMDGEQDRYTTWDEAEKGHATMVEKVRAATCEKFPSKK